MGLHNASTRRLRGLLSLRAQLVFSRILPAARFFFRLNLSPWDGSPCPSHIRISGLHGPGMSELGRH